MVQQLFKRIATLEKSLQQKDKEIVDLTARVVALEEATLILQEFRSAILPGLESVPPSGQ